MKIEYSKSINPFGGLNFVFDHFDKLGFDKILKKNLPQLAAQSKFDWKDIFYSTFAIYFCGGDCIEDISTHLKEKISDNPFCKIPSPDTIQARFKSLSVPLNTYDSKGGKYEHQFSINQKLNRLNMLLLKRLEVFDAPQLTIDYDNTIISTCKADSRPAYKGGRGYQPGIATINVNHVLYVENRNGNTGANSRQDETLQRLFNLLEENGIKKIANFRADGASYQESVIKTVEKYCDNFFIAIKSYFAEKYVKAVTEWSEFSEVQGVKTYVGHTYYLPFQSHRGKKENWNKTKYRLVIKKIPRKDGQINTLTGEAYDYHGVVTNNEKMSDVEVMRFYHQRGTMEKQIGILKNDYGWKKLPFSKIEYNTVFLIIMGMCNNLYQNVITNFSKKYKGLASHFRIKKFIFRFICIPSKWIKRSRKKRLKIFGTVKLQI